MIQVLRLNSSVTFDLLRFLNLKQREYNYSYVQIIFKISECFELKYSFLLIVHMRF